MVDGACQIKSKIKSRARRPGSRPEWLKQKHSNSTATHFYLMHCDPNVGASKPAPTFDRVQATPIYLINRNPNVGAGLLAKAVGQLAHVSLAQRLREQARSHSLTEYRPPAPHCFCFSVGAGLPAMQAPRYIRHTQSMPSQASQLPPLIEFSLQDQVGCQAASLALLI